MNQNKLKVIIDTDGGIDDAMGILFALHYYDVIGITCVSGNIHVDQVCNNVGVILELMNKYSNINKIPFYRGCENPILNKWVKPSFDGHGADGLGNTNMVTTLQPEKEHATNAIIRIVKEHYEEQKDIHLISIGPMTNIATSILLFPQLPKYVASFTAMAGAHHSKGNTGLASEFNVNTDPEAAHICLTNFPKTRLVTWETTLEQCLPWKWIDTIIKDSNNKNSIKGFIADITESFVKQTKKFDPGFVCCDLLAVSSLICEDKDSSKELYCEVELHGQLSRGATLFDWYYTTSNKPNVSLIRVDTKKILNLVNNFIDGKK